MRKVAFIPARAGSKRIKDKNIRALQGHPLIAYSIQSAIVSGIFDAVIVSTDSERYRAIAEHYGAEVPFLRPDDIAGEKSPDIEWVAYTLKRLADGGNDYDIFSILRPTSPFRKAETIRRAWQEFERSGRADSLRAVELCKQHPGKMWVIRNGTMTPLLPLTSESQPWHSSQYAALPPVYAQNASLEIARSAVVFEQGTIAGQVILPFLTEGDEGLDVNEEFDWWKVERVLETGAGRLPEIDRPPFFGS